MKYVRQPIKEGRGTPGKCPGCAFFELTRFGRIGCTRPYNSDLLGCINRGIKHSQFTNDTDYKKARYFHYYKVPDLNKQIKII
jgi:hypothetical protein